VVIYQAVFPNGKTYIGKSINFKNRMYHHLRDAKKGSNLIFHRVIMKYGSESLEWNIIYECEDLNLLSEKEIFFINRFCHK
jgi:group I intron endonuclease